MIWFFLVCFFLSFFCAFLVFVYRRKNQFVPEKVSSHPHFAILIPARDESCVISSLLESIRTQKRKVAMKDVYVIVERKDDPTVLICKKYHASVIYRQHLELQRKGYALDEAITYFKEHHLHYDAYFIFDADNVLDPNFIQEMEKDYLQGYAISTGYRNLINGNDTILAASSGLIYTFINEWMNHPGNRFGKNVMLSGTGFYIHGSYIDQWECYPFHSLTEDVELSFEATLQGMSTHYNPNAIFYDEQPVTFSQTVVQRKRWLKGFFDNYCHYFPKFVKKLPTSCNPGSILSMMLSILAVIFFVLPILVLFLVSLFCILLFQHPTIYLFYALSLFFIVYFVLFCLTYFLLHYENDRLQLQPRIFFGCLWYHPLFLMTYVLVVIQVILHPDVTWSKIEHKGKSK